MAKGRPTAYRDEYAEQVYKLCLLGATDAEISDFFAVNESTLHRWVKAHPEFCESRARGKIAADAEVADKLYQRALGYSHPEVHVSTYEGDVTLTPITKQYPPDTQAASWWLKNRQPSKWKDKTETELSGTLNVQQTAADTIRAKRAARLKEQSELHNNQ